MFSKSQLKQTIYAKCCIPYRNQSLDFHANQVTGFYMEYDTRLKHVKRMSDFNRNQISKLTTGIELTNFKWFVKKTRWKFWGFMNFFCRAFGISRIKTNYKRNSSTLKHALVNNNKESIIEPRKEKKISCLSIPKKSIYLFTHIYFVLKCFSRLLYNDNELRATYLIFLLLKP